MCGGRPTLVSGTVDLATQSRDSTGCRGHTSSRNGWAEFDSWPRCGAAKSAVVTGAFGGARLNYDTGSI